MENTNMKLEKAIKETDLVERVAACNSEDEIRRVLAEKEICLDKVEFRAFINVMKFNFSEKDEFDEESLDVVVGGASIQSILRYIRPMPLPILLGKFWK